MCVFSACYSYCFAYLSGLICFDVQLLRRRDELRTADPSPQEQSESRLGDTQQQSNSSDPAGGDDPRNIKTPSNEEAIMTTPRYPNETHSVSFVRKMSRFSLCQRYNKS